MAAAAPEESNMDFWLFDHLAEEPFGMLPLANLNAKGGPTMLKNYERIASYSWFMDDAETPTIVVPGHPKEFIFWNGGRLKNDEGVLVYDVNHLKLPDGPLDPIIYLTQLAGEAEGNPVNFQQDFDLIMDSINLQKLFAFCQSTGGVQAGSDGLFRIDFERVGNVIVAKRVEASDLMQIDHETFDQALKQKGTKPNSHVTSGPFFQLAKYTFGSQRILVRFEADCADYAILTDDLKPDKDRKIVPPAEQPERHKFSPDNKLEYMAEGHYGFRHKLMNFSTVPADRGLPFFMWAQLCFSGCDAAVIGQYKGANDFARPACYSLQDMNKLIKPLPLTTLAKVHDCLDKICKFVRKNVEGSKVALIWKGQDNMEIYEKTADAPGALSNDARKIVLGEK